MTQRHCPDCNVPLVEKNHGPLRVDKCPQCRGVWLDKGEMNQIVELTLHGAMPRALKIRLDEPDPT